jgi:CHAD domain-containing protein
MKAASPSVALLQRRARALIDALPGAIAGDPAALHRARVASRRLREAFPVAGAAAPGGAQRKVRKLARRLTRALGTVRELDVTLQILEERAEANDGDGSAIDRARGLVRVEREGRRAEMIRRLSQINPDKVQRRLAAFTAEVAAAASDHWRRALAARLALRARRLAQAIARAGSIYIPDRLHGVRIAAKQLRYTLELAAEVGVTDVRPLVSTVKRAQTTLGRLQDLQVVLRQVDAASAEPGLEPAARAGLARLAQTLEEEARRAHARYLRWAPRLVAVCAATRRQIVQSLAAAGRQRALLMKVPKRSANAGVAGPKRSALRRSAVAASKRPALRKRHA